MRGQCRLLDERSIQIELELGAGGGPGATHKGRRWMQELLGAA